MIVPGFNSNIGIRIATAAFVAIFFGYLFGPLIVMSITAFNSSAFPRVTPWECFTVEWFDVLRNDERLMNGLQNSVMIGMGVVLVSVPIGLAGALMLTQVGPRVRPWYYTLTIAPILIPGVVLGIATLIFWRRLEAMFFGGAETFFSNGIFLTIIGQATFISAYAMLVFISRLQRFDSVQEEAALDLGATQMQTFRKILLPFMRPAIGSAAVLAFLASFENYNTTVFTITAEETLTTVLASKVRYGIDPSISALSVVIIGLTIIGAVYFEIIKRREDRYQREVQKLVATGSTSRASKAALVSSPAFVIVTLIFIAGLGTIYFAGTIGVEQCKIAVEKQQQLEIQRRIQERRAKQMFRRAPQPGSEATSRPATGASGSDEAAKGTEGYRNIFAPNNLQDQVESKDESDTDAKGTEGYQSIFDPGNLKQQSGSGASE